MGVSRLSALHSVLARLSLIARAPGALQFLSNLFGDAIQRARLSGDVALSTARAPTAFVAHSRRAHIFELNMDGDAMALEVCAYSAI